MKCPAWRVGRACLDGGVRGLSRCAGRPLASYARRRPEQTALYQVVRSHLPAMLAAARAETAHGFGLPRLIEREFEGYLGCGVLGRGFARVRCDVCSTSTPTNRTGSEHGSTRQPRCA